ncbi:MAG TPA: AIM24 family protein [Pyrinomonadaceae bacterium]|nr:AIM24 family protein [Pyrinomonadaceae bacterium]
MRTCPTCQRPVAEGQKFCSHDGTRIPQDAQPAQAFTPAPPVASPVPPQYAPPPPQQNVAHAPHASAQDAPIERLKCQWCESMNEKGATTCRTCGAPLDIKNLVSESGWREAPRLKDMTEFQFGQSTCQVEGEIVPVAELNLAPGDAVYFEHHVLLWKDDATPMSTMPLQGGIKRVLAGMPFIISVANGPGRVAFSRDATGELVVLPLHPGMELDVREHAFLLASHHINYSFVRVKGLRNILFGGQGMFMDRFVTGPVPGMLILHGYGNVFERVLRPGESIMVEPGAFLYKDSSVTMDVEFVQLTSGWFGGSTMSLARMTGPGRVGIQSMYVHHHTE